MASGKDSDRNDTEVKLPRPTRVKNKTPAPVQITAEQILRESREMQDAEIRPPKQKITDSTELSDYWLRRRKEFEDQIRGARCNIQDWVKYAQWEESQKDYERARSVWKRALDGDSYRNHTLWVKYAEFEMKNKLVDKARNVWERAVSLLPRVDQLWYKYIHMEEILGNIDKARVIFERWMDTSPDQQAWLSFIKFELRYNEIESAQSIHQRFILCHPKVSAYAEFALDHIHKEGNEDAILGKRRIQYEDEVRKNPLNYDSWFDYVRLEESVGNKDRIREIYERAIANVPPAEEKRYWKRYIYLWIDYALYEEIETEDVERTRAVYRECLNRIPHKKFSFAKIWLLAAEFEIRQLNLAGARKILGNAIGKAPKGKIFKKYIEIELQLGNIDRCRKLYERYLEWSPENCYAWSKFAELERSLGETERARAVFELAISQPALDMPVLLWKAYIDFEISQGESERTRALYERLLDRTKHYKVWVSFAKFEAEQGEDDVIEHKKDCIRRARAIFDRGNTYYNHEMKEERAMLLQDWLNMEISFGNLGDVSVVQSKLPKKLKKRKLITREDGSTGYEEYIDYLFPEESKTTNLKILEAAYKWKKQKVTALEDRY